MNSDELAHLVDRVLADLERVPGWAGLSFRGMPDHASFGRETRTAVAGGLVPTSRDPRVATENFTTPGLFAIVGSEGRAIESASQFPDEQEVVFLPASVFSFVATANYDGYPIVVARQVNLADEQSPLDREALIRRVGGAIRAAKASAPAEVTSPGKYVGDID
jgi:hypothetical protein